MEHVAVSQHHFHAQHIVPGHAVAHGAHSAGVGHGVAAHGGGLFAGIRRIKQPRALHALGELHQQNARFHGGGHVLRVHFQYFLHFFSGKDDAAVLGHAAAAQAGAGAARCNGDVALVAVFQHGADFFGLQGLQHRFGAIAAIDGHFIVVVIRGNLLAGKHPARHDRFKESKIVRIHGFERLHALSSFSFWIIRGTIWYRSPTMAIWATLKMGASGSVLMATICSL